MEGKAIVNAWSIWLFPIQYVCCPSLSLVVLLQEVSLKTSVFVYYSTCHSTDSCPLSMAFLVYTQIIYSSLSHDLSTFKFIHSVCLIKSPSFGIFLSLKSSVLLSQNYIFFPQSAFTDSSPFPVMHISLVSLVSLITLSQPSEHRYLTLVSIEILFPFPKALCATYQDQPWRIYF